MNTAELMKELMLDEGYKQEVYLDHLGYPTFGVGHLITKNDEEHGKDVGTPVSKERIEKCLQQQLPGHEIPRCAPRHEDGLRGKPQACLW